LGLDRYKALASNIIMKAERQKYLGNRYTFLHHVQLICLFFGWLYSVRLTFNATSGAARRLMIEGGERWWGGGGQTSGPNN
jgi:hypothetical protein